MPDAGKCSIETHDETFIGEFHICLIEFTPEKLVIELRRPHDKIIEVTIGTAAYDFAKAAHVMQIITGDADPFLRLSDGARST